MAVSEQQNQPRPSGILRPIRFPIRSPCQLHTVRIRQGDCVLPGRESGLYMDDCS